MSLTSVLLDFVHLLYPTNCLLCGESLVKSEKHICISCLHKLPYADFYFEEDNYIEKRFWGKVQIANASALLVFEKGNSVQKLIHQLKYKGQKELGAYLGRLMALDFKDSLDGVDYIFPVPMHKRKRKQRGYNQSECLAEGIASILNTSIDSECLIRVNEKDTQTRKSVYDRWQNMSGVFDLMNCERFAGKHILLVDDVLTTGSTFEACIIALQKTKNIEISVLALAVANH